MRDLLPPQLDPVHGIEYAGGYRASEDYEVVGGDFYDVHPVATPTARRWSSSATCAVRASRLRC